MELSSVTGKHVTKEIDKHYYMPESGSLSRVIQSSVGFFAALYGQSGEIGTQGCIRRNARVHKKVSKSGKEIVNFVHSYILELNEIETKRPKVFPVVSKWKHPPDQFVKINFDAAYVERSSQSALGIVARNSEGKVLLACSKIHNQAASAFAAEAITCRSATQLGIDMKWENIIIEGDSLSIIKKCRTKSHDKSLIGAYIHDIQQISLKTQKCSFEYIPRTANCLAHSIVTETMKSNKEVYLIGKVPEYAEKLNERDSVREPD
ncbi:hypothetical protein Gogos_020650 [Gossypium gossypioides]|uniref:RNase H type-1 domain-containing protein n=1 Tax=Gossypium gossypioides TaxID=34282 RepID=A0A7J9D756_GOSGO|nr:hypothetical protein [Gossypium gossypioides]